MKFNPTIGGQFSGKLGGMVASHNKGGQYLRRHSIPVNPRTNAQEEARSGLRITTAAYQKLSAEQKEQWRSYGSNIRVKDRVGQTYSLTGNQAFADVNGSLFALKARTGYIYGEDGSATVVPAPVFNVSPVLSPPSSFDRMSPVSSIKVNYTGDAETTIVVNFSAPTPASGVLFLGVPNAGQLASGRGVKRYPYLFAISFGGGGTSVTLNAPPAEIGQGVALALLTPNEILSRFEGLEQIPMTAVAFTTAMRPTGLSTIIASVVSS